MIFVGRQIPLFDTEYDEDRVEHLVLHEFKKE